MSAPVGVAAPSVVDTPARARDHALEKFLATAEPVASDAVLAVQTPFCRACGTDHELSDRVCSACGHDTAPLPPRLEGPLGELYELRPGLRRRKAVRLGDDAAGAQLLFESGEVSVVALDALPNQADPLVPIGRVPGVRTRQGVLLRLAAAQREGELETSWDPQTLVTAALATVTDETTARLFADDALRLRYAGVTDHLPLTHYERFWLRAVYAAATGDAATAVQAVAMLPIAGYRPKLGLLVCVVREAMAVGLDLRALQPHLEAFAPVEPVATLLQRTLFGTSPTSTNGAVSAVAAENMALIGTPGLPAPVRVELAAALDALDGKSPVHTGALHLLPTNARLIVACTALRPGLIGSNEIDRIPLPLLDDLLESGAVRGEDVLAGSADPGRTPYLRARVSPGRLSDEEVDRLDHAEERVRRAFRRRQLKNLESAGDLESARHFRALLTVTAKRGEKPSLEDVRPQARPIVEELLTVKAAVAEGAALGPMLSDRMVGDPTVWPTLVEIAGSTGLEPTPELQARFPAFTEWLSLHQAREYLYLGDWRSAVAAADRCLALAHDEAVRDEALNLKACGLHHLGDDPKAIAALEEAIEGMHTEALLANIGVVAAGLEPETAARHLGVLMAEAPTMAMRVAAARRALAIWSTSDTATWRNSDASPLPDAFQDSLRALAVGPLDIADFRDIISVLALHDSEWVADERSIAGSPHASTLEARFYVARARSLIEMIEVMGAVMRGGSAPEWILDERDSLRSATVDILFENLDEPDTTFGAVALAMADQHVLRDMKDHLLCSLLGVASFSYHLTTRDEEVADHIVQRTLELRRDWERLDGEDRQHLEPLIELATRRVALNRMSARDRELARAIETYNGAIGLGSDAYPGSPAHAEAMRRIASCAQIAAAARDDVRPLLPLIDHEGARDDINKTVEMSRELERRCLAILN